MVIAPCPDRACFKLPAIVQMSSLYFAIVEILSGEPPVVRRPVRPPIM